MRSGVVGSSGGMVALGASEGPVGESSSGKGEIAGFSGSWMALGSMSSSDTPSGGKFVGEEGIFAGALIPVILGVTGEAVVAVTVCFLVVDVAVGDVTLGLRFIVGVG